MTLLEHLSELTGSVFSSLGLPAELGEVVPSQRADLADFQCNGAMAAAKLVGRPPRDIAAEVAEGLATSDGIASAGVAGAGFVNIVMSPDALASWGERTATDDALGMPRVVEPLTVVVDYAGPNVAKAMHVGHLRATIIGDSVARLFAFAGHRVIRDPHFGDWGFQIGLLIAALEEENPGLTEELPSLTLDDLQRIYPEAAARAERDESFSDRARAATVRLQRGDPGYRELWRRMKTVSEESQRADFSALGVEFDLWYGESDVGDRMEPLVERLRTNGVAETSDGALVIRVDETEDNRVIPPLILKSSAGGFLYSTTDLATLEMRAADLGADLILYVVDRRQSDHFLQLFRAARRAGLVPETTQLEHIGFGTMNGPDGRPFKTREGGVVRLGDVIRLVTETAYRRLEEAHLAEEYPEEERERIASLVGLAALKFGDLVNNRASDYVFDLDRFSSFEGKTGPYVQYAAVRIKSILRRAAKAGLESGEYGGPEVGQERQLVLQLLRLPEVVQRAIALRAPNHVAEHAHGVAVAFNRFYDTCHILSEPDVAHRASWLRLSEWTLAALTRLLDLLGIEVPDRM